MLLVLLLLLLVVIVEAVAEDTAEASMPLSAAAEGREDVVVLIVKGKLGCLLKSQTYTTTPGPCVAATK